MIQILHNPHCSKSNCALDYLKEHQIEFELRDYQKEPLTASELKEVCNKLGVAPEAIVRKTEPLFQKQFAGGSYDDEEWFHILADNPVLLQRPIVVNGQKAVLARPTELIVEVLDN